MAAARRPAVNGPAPGPPDPGDTPPPAAAAPRRGLPDWARAEGVYFIEILALCSFTFARPILQIFGNDPQTFLAQGAGRATVLLFALGVALLPPLALWAAATTTRLLGATPRRLAQAAVLGGLTALFTRGELARTFALSRSAIWGLALVAGAALVALFWFAPPFRSFLHFAAISAPVFVALFVVASPVARIFGTSSARAAEVRTGRPVVWLVFDELPTASLLDGHGGIDAGLFPNFAALARDATWFRNNTTVGTITQNAVPAIMTGRYATAPYTVPVSSNYPESIFTLLGDRFPMHVSERVTHVCPTSLCSPAQDNSLGTQLRSLFGDARSIWPEYARRASKAPKGFSIGGNPVDTRRIPAFHEFLDGVAATRGPRLDFAHILLPHQPWEFLPDEKVYESGNDGMIYYGWSSADAGRIARQRHLLQLRLADRYLGEILERLRSNGTYDDAVVVVTADHGAGFGDGQLNRALDKNNLIDVAFTPLIVKAPGLAAGRVDDRNAQTIDVLPTVAELLGVKIPWKVDGVSLLGPPRRDDRKAMVVTPAEHMKPDDRHRYHFRGDPLFRELLSRPAATEPGPAGLRIFRTGDLGLLVGEPASDLADPEPSRFHGRFLLGPRPFHPRSGHAPVYYRAVVDAPKGTTVALAVNGRIGAWMRLGPAYITEANFWGVVPESFLRTGANDVRLYEVTGDGTRFILRPISTG